ncbi:MAG: hypothetical protein ACR2NM_15355 [Bythopirellula sp.]
MCRFLIISVLLGALAVPSYAQVSMIFQEDFDQLPLRDPQDEDFPPVPVFTRNGPSGWEVDRSGVPGIGEPGIGVFEWEGWSFANKNFWTQVSNDEGRSDFTRGQGTIAVADPDEWNDLGFPTAGGPANVLGFYNTFMTTQDFHIPTLLQSGSRLQLKFDSSWRDQCCDDGEQFAPNQNNKTATVRAVFEDGSISDNLLHWESAPFINPFNGGPSTNPNHPPNPLFKDINANELVFVDLSSLLTSTHLTFKLEFGLTKSGDDWWWAMDNMQMISTGFEIDGDMDLNGSVEEADIAHFAQAVHNETDYVTSHYGESPSVRGSPDSNFDFDDIDWFVGVLNDEGIAATQATVVAAINAYGVPEPSSGCLAVCCVLVGWRRHRVGC